MSSPNNASLQAERASLLDKPFSSNGSTQAAQTGANATLVESLAPFLNVLLRALSAWPS